MPQASIVTVPLEGGVMVYHTPLLGAPVDPQVGVGRTSSTASTLFPVTVPPQGSTAAVAQSSLAGTAGVETQMVKLEKNLILALTMIPNLPLTLTGKLS